MNHPYQYHPTAETHVWLTPRKILDALGPFDLDPCGCDGWNTAREIICPPQDGLGLEWTGRVWCNPPFGHHTKVWLRRMARHGNGVALTFARTDTRMFHEMVWPCASGILFLAGRPFFHRADGSLPDGNCGGPICLIAYGLANLAALRDSGLAGALVCGAKMVRPDDTLKNLVEG